MTDVPTLGRLVPVDLRTVWASEPYSFTPWLALPENLALLADAIGLPGLEHVATEHTVSEFSVDIVAKISGTDDLVAIENQLERSDHTHLGQCLTYAAGTEARIIVWVVRAFTEGHRAALDWLNRKTTEDVAFFGVEVSAVRIGDSLPAPQFKVVVRPNNWARYVRDQAAASSLTPDNLSNMAYWEAFDPIAEAHGVKHGMARQGRGWNYFHYLRESKTTAISAFIARSSNRIGAYVAVYGWRAKFFDKLREQKAQIEAEFGGPLDWTPPGKPAPSAAVRFSANPDDATDWPRQHEWMAVTMAKLRDVFEPRLAALGVFDAENELEEQASPKPDS